jgi:hypothetical protein
MLPQDCYLHSLEKIGIYIVTVDLYHLHFSPIVIVRVHTASRGKTNL